MTREQDVSHIQQIELQCLKEKKSYNWLNLPTQTVFTSLINSFQTGTCII